MQELPKYFQPITRKQPTACVIAIDCSASMQNIVEFGGTKVPKSHAVSMVANLLLHELILRATREEGVRHYYDVAVLGYNGIRIESLLGGDKELVPIDELAAREPEIRKVKYQTTTADGTPSQAIYSYKSWFDSYAVGLTPMNEMLDYATHLLDGWCRKPEHADSFPPMVINITDGEATDGFDHKLLESAMRLRELSTSDGNVLLMTIHISSTPQSNAVIFPTRDEVPSDIYARMMADMSSELPPCFDRKVLSMRRLKERPEKPFLAMAFNIVPYAMFNIIDIGTRTTR